MKFSQSFTWSNHHLGIISRLRVENKTTPYTHTHRLEIERCVSQKTSVENTLQEAEEQLASTSTSHTLVPHEKAFAGCRCHS